MERRQPSSVTRRKNTEFGNMKKKSKDYIDGMKRATKIASRTEAAARVIGDSVSACFVDEAIRLIRDEIRRLEK